MLRQGDRSRGEGTAAKRREALRCMTGRRQRGFVRQVRESRDGCCLRAAGCCHAERGGRKEGLLCLAAAALYITAAAPQEKGQGREEGIRGGDGAGLWGGEEQEAADTRRWRGCWCVNDRNKRGYGCSKGRFAVEDEGVGDGAAAGGG